MSASELRPHVKGYSGCTKHSTTSKQDHSRLPSPSDPPEIGLGLNYTLPSRVVFKCVSVGLLFAYPRVYIFPVGILIPLPEFLISHMSNLWALHDQCTLIEDGRCTRIIDTYVCYRSINMPSRLLILPFCIACHACPLLFSLMQSTNLRCCMAACSS